ncbi:hypothetical protein B1C78_03480 [Thioalkalivibrio denitrificans]|uniref:Uncharacterized protein n=1 Tax=Thioalkalivibrio denitrificans TaxID=108003 RepID=A0A1V3NRH5_9GAMM|nr:hypothetical protein B1C78_03480 [Thioalkalivibrio denitrificans]
MTRLIAPGVLAVEQPPAHKVEVPPGRIDQAQLPAQEAQQAQCQLGSLVLPLPALEHPGRHPAALGRLFEVEPEVSPAQILEIPVLGMLQGPHRHPAQAFRSP